MAVRNVSEQNSLHQLQRLLPPKFQDIFMEQQSRESFGHMNLFNTMHQLNVCFSDVLDSVSAYRADLALMLQQMIESYNSIFLQQYEVFYDEKFQKEVHLENQLLRNKEIENEYIKLKEELN